VFYNLEEAKIRATQEAYDSGLIFQPEYEEGTQFGEWTLKGGRDYEEKLLVLPEATDRSKNYTGGHFQEDNVVAHIRSTSRMIGNKRAHFIEEFQSDWWLDGRQMGFAGENKKGLHVEKERGGYFGIFDKDGNRISSVNNPYNTEAEANEVVQHMINQGVPKMPFTNTWPDLAFRRAVYDAAGRDADVIAWTNGAEQADRYDLRNYVDEIQVTLPEKPVPGEKVTREVVIGVKNGRPIPLEVDDKGIITHTTLYSQRDIVGKPLEEFIGKEMADKIMAAEKHGTFSGVDLYIGGEGKKKLYDKMFPKIANKFAKKYGEKAELVDMETPDGVVKVWQLKLTPEMKKDILKGGVALSALPMAAMPKEKEK